MTRLDLQSLWPDHEIEVGYHGFVSSLGFSPDGERLLIAVGCRVIELSASDARVLSQRVIGIPEGEDTEEPDPGNGWMRIQRLERGSAHDLTLLSGVIDPPPGNDAHGIVAVQGSGIAEELSAPERPFLFPEIPGPGSPSVQATALAAEVPVAAVAELGDDDDESRLIVLDIHTGERKLELSGYCDGMWSLALDRRAETLAIAEIDYSLKLAKLGEGDSRSLAIDELDMPCRWCHAQLVFDKSGLWIAADDPARLLHLDVRTGKRTEIVAPAPRALPVAAGVGWAAWAEQASLDASFYGESEMRLAPGCDEVIIARQGASSTRVELPALTGPLERVAVAPTLSRLAVAAGTEIAVVEM